MNWKAAFTENWPYKVAALVLAVLLWFNVSADQERPDQPVPTRLEFQIRDSAWVPVQWTSPLEPGWRNGLPSEARAVFSGARGGFFGFIGDRPVIPVTIEEVTGPEMRIGLQPGMVRYDPDTNLNPIAVRPDEVTLRFERVVEKRVPVTVDLRASAAPGFTIVGGPALERDSVRVRGAASDVESLTHVRTESISLDGLRETVTRQLPLQAPSGRSTIRVSPSQVLATFTVDSLVERRFTVRVASPEGSTSPTFTPPDVSVSVRGARSVLEGLEADDIRAFVELPRGADGRPRIQGEVRLPVDIRLPEGLSATATAEPPSVTAAPARREGERPPGSGRP